MLRHTAWALPTAALAFSVTAGAIGYHAAVRRTSGRAGVMPARSPGGSTDRAALHVPHVSASIVLDGDTDDPGWTAPPGPARTGPFVLSNGAPARPYSDARLAWGDGHLYVALYAADEDIRSSERDPARGDSFRLRLSCGGTVRVIDVSPGAAVTGVLSWPGAQADPTWTRGTHVSREIDGTIDDPTDSDEEWVIEMAISFAVFGAQGRPGEHISFAVSRCDSPKRGPRICAGWGRWQAGDTMRGAAEARGEIVLD